MTDLTTIAVLAALVLSSAALGDADVWACPECRFRTTVARPTPYRDDTPRPAEAAVDFALLLKRAGIDGEFDPASLRLVADGAEAPFAYRSEYDARGRRERAYLTWPAHPRPDEIGSCDIYFDTSDRGVEPRDFGTDRAPAENLLLNPGFEEDDQGLPTAWKITSPLLVSLGKWITGTGERSLQVRVDENTPADADRVVFISQTVDVAQFAGQEVLFECALLAERATYGAPITVRLEQYRADGSRIPEYAIQPRWLTVELAQGQRAQFSEPGKLSPDAATVDVRIGFRCYVKDADTNETVEGPESHFTVWLDRVLFRACERWPWPAASHAGFVEGPLGDAPLNRAFEFTGGRRLAFNGGSEGTRTANSYHDARSVHWGLERGTLELWCKPSWNTDDGVEHVLFYGSAYGHRLQSRLRKRTASAKNALEFTIVDAGKKAHTVSGQASLKAGQWSHIAATWDCPAAHLQLFVDGRLIGSIGPGDEPWPSSLAHTVEGRKKGIGISATDTRSMPMQAFIGGDHKWTESGSAEAAIDEFRISDAVRYADEFDPSRAEFAVDENTRALFHFENEKHGVHDSDDRFVRGYLGCELAPQAQTAVLEVRDETGISRREVVVRPHASVEQFESNRAENRMMVTRPFESLPDPRYIEFRRRSVERVVATGHEQFSLDVGGDLEPLMQSVTFEHARGDDPKTTLLPRWRANDNVVPLSVETIARTLAPDVEDDVKKAFEVFKYSLQVTNYYDAHYCETLPQRHRPRVSYTLLKHLNIYPFDQCGPLNHTLRKLFLAAGISSNNASGTHHQFQQAFYDGSLRLFDLSGRVFWLNRDNATRLSLRGLEDEPYLKIRQGGVANSWLPGRRSQATFGAAQRPHSMDFPLRPGERASICWHNEGRWFELTGDRKSIPLAKIPPYFGNGAIVYEPTARGDAAEFVNMSVEGAGAESVLRSRDDEKPGSMTYRAACPYILSGATVSGSYTAARPDAIILSLSLDDGKTWREVWRNADAKGRFDVDLGEHVMARYAYLLRLELAPGGKAEVRGLRVRSVLVASPLSLPGRLTLGANRVAFVGGPVDAPIRTSCAWIERHKSELAVSSNALSFYHNSGEAHRNVFIVAPGEECPVTVTLAGRPMRGELSIEQEGRGNVEPLKRPVELAHQGETTSAEFSLRFADAKEGDIRAFDVVLREGDGERRAPAQALIANAALVCEAEAADVISGGATLAPLAELSGAQGVLFAEPGELAFEFSAPAAGEYALWLRARWEPDSSTAMELAFDGQKPRDLRAAAMIGFTDWTARSRAHAKMFAHFGEQYGHWAWYRVADINLEAGGHTMALSARAGAFFDALALLPATAAVDRAAMNLFQNWNFAPWLQPI